MADNKQVVRPGSYLKRERDVVQKATTVTPMVWGAISREDVPVENGVIEVKSFKDFKEKFCMTDEQAKTSKLALAVNLWFLLNSSSMFIYNESPYTAKAEFALASNANFEAKYPGLWAEDVSIKVTDESIVVKYNGITEVLEKTLNGVNQSKFIQIQTTRGVDDDAPPVTDENIASMNEGTVITLSTKGATLPEEDDTKKQSNMDTYLEKLMTEDTITVVTEYAYNSDKLLHGSATKLEEDLGVKVLPITAIEFVDITKDLPVYTGYRGMVCTPYVKVMNPITGVTEEQPPTVAVPAIFGKLITQYGIQQAPAGVEAILPNVTGVTRAYTEREQGVINASNINCIIPKKRYGVVIWGNRLINSDQDRDYVSDLLLDDYIDNWIKADTETFVFKNADDIMYSEITARITAFLRELWSNGALAGETANEAFVVRCDKELNADAPKGEVYAEVGWAKKYPAEFIYTTVKYMSV